MSTIAKLPARRPPPLVGRRGGAMPAILALSLALHVAVIAAAARLDRTGKPPPQGEVAVEVVPEMPGEAKPPTVKPPGQDAKAEQAAGKAAQAEAAKPEPAKIEPAKPEPVKPEPAVPEQAKADPAKPVERDRAERDAEQEKAQAELQAMRDELARLQAEQQVLQAEASQPAPDPVRALATGAGQPAGAGSLASSFQAIALPQEAADGEGELVGYQAIVFSRLAKAKSVGRQLGIPGSAGIAFTLDEHGALLSVRLAVSSGIAKLDEEALAIVRKAAPFPAPPEGAQRSFEANVNFVGGAGG